MKFNELAQLVEQTIKEAPKPPKISFKEKSNMLTQKELACDFVPTENRFTQDETGEEVAKLALEILQQQYQKFTMADPPYEQSQDSKKEFKREWKIYGAPMQRGTFTAELAKQLRAAGIEAYSSADAALYQQCHPKKKLPGGVRDKGKGIIVLYEMEDGTKERWYFAYKPSKQAKSGYATKYEGNLIYAINIAGGQSEAKANELAGSRNEDAADQVSADDVIGAIKWGGKPTKAQRASGGTLDSVKLTDLYLRHKVKSTEPKTDIFVWLGKDRKNVSVKAATGAQYASAQGPEAVAIFEAAFKDVEGKGAASKKDYYKTVESILTKFGGRATGEGVATFEPMREQYAKETGQAATALQGDVSDTILGDCTGEECKHKLTQLTALAKNPQAIAKVEENQKKKLAEMNDAAKKEALVSMQGALNEAVPKIAQATQDWMKSPEARKLILREAVTGENKFVTKEAIADAVLKWDDTDFSKSSWALLDDKWFSDHVGETKYDFRSRGGSGLANRGIAFRLDALTENKTPSALLSSTENQELGLLWEAMVLTEGPWSDVLAKTKQKAQQFISTTTDKLKQLGAEGQKIYNAIKAVAAKAWKNIKEYATKLYESGVQFVKDSVKKVQEKIMAVVQDFGTMFGTFFDVNSAVIDVGEGTAAEGPQLELKEHLTQTPLSYKMLVEMIENLMSTA